MLGDKSDRVSVAEIADAVARARNGKYALRVVGAGTWLDAGRPVSPAAQRLDTSSLAGIVAYEPGDLTLSVRAGTPLAEIERITGEAGQWLPLDPFGSAQGTIGATIASASYGPLASAFGTPRDQVLGCEFVSGKGEVVRAGGQVVKNVAGFDLVRLLTGAWGSLGVLTEVSLRLRARPELEHTLAIACDAEAAWRWLRASDFTPYAAELLSPSLIRALGINGGGMLLLRFGGNAALLDAARQSAATLGELEELDTSAWATLSAAEPHSAAVVRFSVKPSRVNELWKRVAVLAEGAGGFAHATLERGIVRCVIPCSPDANADRLVVLLQSMRGDATCIAERLPAALWPVMAPVVNVALARRVLDAFDPDRVLNPGITGDLTATAMHKHATSPR